MNLLNAVYGFALGGLLGWGATGLLCNAASSIIQKAGDYTAIRIIPGFAVRFGLIGITLALLAKRLGVVGLLAGTIGYFIGEYLRILKTVKTKGDVELWRTKTK